MGFFMLSGAVAMNGQSDRRMLYRIAFALLLHLPPAVTAQDLDTAVSALVRISGTRDGATVRGSGFVVGLAPGKATVVTASHVIEGAEQLRVTFAADRTESFPAGAVLGMESGNPRGLAVFQVRGALPEGVGLLNFDTETQLRRGEDVFLLGYPEMAQAPLALRRTFAGTDGNLLQLDQPVGEGISGAPVLRNGGGVLGVVVEVNGGIALAVKALLARDAVLGWGASLGSRSGTISNPPQLPPTAVACTSGQTATFDDIVYVRICPGTFTMGSADNDSQYGDEKPAHQVTLSEEFWLGQTEVTNKQYRRLQLDHEGVAELPAVNVSWTEAKTACERFGGRLPTEAEWEYAARAGSETAWSFGGDKKMLGGYGWYDQNAGNKPHPVATKKPNPWGLYDMHGNAWEWVADWYVSYTKAAQRNPAGTTPGKARLLRGGGFSSWDGNLRSAFRFLVYPEYQFAGSGFRCARDPRRQP
jgi:hypothetical protein